MAPLDAPSPTPSNLPASGVKRPRPSAAAGGAAGTSSRTKRRKAEDGTDADEAGAGGGRGKNPVNFGVGMVKGREDEWGEPPDVVTKIDFNTLPDETLYRYLEFHDLLPRWDASPWSEKPCTPPNALYTLAPPPPAIPIVPEPVERPVEVMAVDPAPPVTEAPAPAPAVPAPTGELATATAPTEAVPATEGDVAGATAKPDSTDAAPAATGEDGQPEGDEETPAPPTTRSKTAPQRKVPTPSPPPTPVAEIKRGVITLSDVHAARAALAEKANAHWVKGLGGGQNKEGETIVNFLYKMKAGPGRLLRVYNPHPPPFSY